MITKEKLKSCGMYDFLELVYTRTGNTIAKLSHAITDGCVTMAAKAHLRNNRPLLLGVSTNDGLGASAKNIGTLLVRKNIFFIPFGQDDPENKCNSLIFNPGMIVPAIEKALEFKQIQPILA